MLLNGLTGTEIHNDSTNIPPKEEATILPLFSSLNSLSNILNIDEVYDRVKKNNRLTGNAEKNWDAKRVR
jgi:nitrate reductase NapAB chaperone NapD